MLNGFRNTLSTTLNSVSGFVGVPSTSRTSASQETNDAAEPKPARTSRSPHSPTSRRAPATIDLSYSPPRRNRFPSSSGGSPTEPFASDRRRVSQTELGRVPGKTKTGATPLPDPRFHFLDRNMGKPGASHAPQPRNTLSEQTYTPLGSVRKTYGHSARSGLMSFPTDDEQFSPDTRAAKRRKTAGKFASETLEREYQQWAEGIWDEDDEKEARAERHPTRPGSQRSADSGRTSHTSLKGTRSEFERAHALANPHRRKSRAGTYIVTDGHAPTKPITLDDDEPGSGLTSRQVQLQSFKQGISASEEAPRRRPSETTSSYFASKMNNSTQFDSASRPRPPKSTNLRDTFHRAPPIKNSWPLTWARSHNYAPDDHNTDLFLRTTDEYNYTVTGADPTDVRCEFAFRRVNTAFSNNILHVRLLGSTNASGCKYTVDLVFAKKEDLHGFLQALARSITQGQVKVKPSAYMRTIFDKPLDSVASPQVVVPARTAQDEARVVSNGSERNSIIGNLLGSSRPATSQSANPETAQTQSDAAAATARPVRNTRQTRTFQFEPDDYEDDPEVDKFSLIHGLGPPWKKQLNYGSGRRRAVVDFADLPRLDNGEFLNDQLIDFYLLYLLDQAKLPQKKVYIFNTHFFSTLTRRVPGQKGKINYKGVARWTQKDDIFGYDYIVVPINQDIHWYLAIICNVSNIVRGPEIEDLTKSDNQASEAVKDVDSDLPTGPDVEVRQSVEAIPPPALIDMKTSTSNPHAGRQNSGMEDSELNTVDGHAIEPEVRQSVEDRSPRTVESPAEETAKLKKLTLSDSRTDATIANSTFTPLNKGKRKSIAPVRKYDPNQPVVVVLDSLLAGARSATVAALKEYLREEGQEKRQIDARVHQNAYYAKGSQIPAQDNYSDCGMYLLGYAQKFFEDPDGFKNRLLSGEMKVDTDWPNMLPPKMRENMRDILQELYKEQEGARKQGKKAEKAAKVDATVKPADDARPPKPAVAEAEKRITEAPSKPADPTAKPTSTDQPHTTHTRSPTSPFHPSSPAKHNSPHSRPHTATTPVNLDPSAPIRLSPSPTTTTTTTTHSSPRAPNPVPLPHSKSPKRHLPSTIHIQVSSPKRRRISPSQSQPKPTEHYAASHHPTIRVRSPSPRVPHRVMDTKAEAGMEMGRKTKTKTKAKGETETEMDVERKKEAKAKAKARTQNRGSSRDPIPIDDSQEGVVVTSPTLTSTSPTTTARRPGRTYTHSTTSVRKGRAYAEEVGEEEEEKAAEVPETPEREDRGEDGEEEREGDGWNGNLLI